MRRIAAHWLIDRGQVMQRPVVSIADDGQIVAIEQWESLDKMAHTEFYAGALTAGFVNAHCHIELSYLRGKIERGSGFAGFARAIGQVRGLYSDEERVQALCAADRQMWQEGVQAVGDIVNGTTSYPMKQQSKIRYHSFAELFGLRSDVDSISPLVGQSATTPTPHSIYSLQDAPFRRVAAQAGDAPLSIHFMESDDEAALYRGEGSLAAWYERMGWGCDFLGYGSPARRIVESVPHERKLLLVHNCCVTKRVVQLVQESFGERASWVLCPRSNSYISGIRPPVELLREAGVRICVGTDSLASNHSLSIVEELKLMREVPLRELVMWATQNGAEALGIAGEKGSLEPGKQCGIVLIEGVERGADEELYLTEKSSARRLV